MILKLTWFVFDIFVIFFQLFVVVSDALFDLVALFTRNSFTFLAFYKQIRTWNNFKLKTQTEKASYLIWPFLINLLSI